VICTPLFSVIRTDTARASGSSRGWLDGTDDGCFFIAENKGGKETEKKQDHSDPIIHFTIVPRIIITPLIFLPMSHASSSSDRSRPTPDRTLRQPHRLNVSHRDAPSISNNTDIHDLRASYTRKAELQRIAERWADRMMEDTLDRQTFKRAVRHTCIIHPEKS